MRNVEELKKYSTPVPKKKRIYKILDFFNNIFIEIRIFFLWMRQPKYLG